MSRTADYSELWGDLEHRLNDLVARLGDRLSPRASRDALDLVDHNEFGEAWHAVAYTLIESGAPINRVDYRELRELAELMRIGETKAKDELEALSTLAEG